MNLSLATQQQFNSVLCDVWKNEQNEIFMTREQIGQALEYADPNNSIMKMHTRNKARLDKFSGRVKLSHPNGGMQETTIYNARGIYEIIRFSKQSKADEFYDFVYELLEKLRKGELIVIQNEPSYMIQDPVERAKRWIEEREEFEENKVYSDYAKRILNSTGTVNISQIGDDYGMSGERMNKLLHEVGIQYKLSKQWLLYAKHKGLEYTDSYTMDITHKDGSQSVQMHTKWTQKGRMFIYETLKAKGILPTMEKAKLRLIESRAN